MQLKRVVVTGLGAITPIGNTASQYWEALLNGVSGCDTITNFDASKFKTQIACEVKNFNVGDFFEIKEAKRLDRFSQLGLVAASEAIEDAGLHADTINKDRVGVIWGSGIGGLSIFQNEIRDFFKGDGTPRFNPFFIPKMIIDICPGHISMKYGFRGMNYATVAACASSTNALIDSFNYIRLGKANAIVTGGSEAPITEGGVGGFSAMKAMSERNDDPKTASRPFDLERDGFVAGEGAASIVLEEYEHAVARGAKIYAEMIGGGMSADAYHLTAPDPDGNGVILVLNDALQDAGIEKSVVDYINVHGTSTPLGDVAELKAIQEVFGETAYTMNISSTKSMTGHLLGAAGAIEAAATILAIKNNIVPPTINHHTADPAIDPRFNLTLNKAQSREIHVAMSNTFGFGGHNASVVFRKFTT
jgi:3-oxoacyl-[acyl-carrier-protein] synthase II